MLQTSRKQQQTKLSMHLSNIPRGLKTGPGIFHVDAGLGCYVTVGHDGKIHKRPINTDDPKEESLLQQWEAFKGRTNITPGSLIYSHRGTKRILRLSFTFAGNAITFVAMEEPRQPTRTIGWFRISHHYLNHGSSSRSTTGSIDIIKHLMASGIPLSPHHILSHQQLSEIQLEIHPESLAAAVMAACSCPVGNTNMVILQETDSEILPTHWHQQWLQTPYNTARTRDAHLPAALIRQLIEHPEAAIYERSSARDSRSIVQDSNSTLIDHAVELADVPELGPQRMPIRKAYRDEVLARNPSIPDTIEVNFYGYGDSGSVEEIWPDIADLDFKVREIPCLITDIFSGYAISAQQNQETEFDDSLRDIVYQILEKYHEGWEIGSGSQGTVGIYLKAEHPYAEILNLENIENGYDEEEEEQEEDIS